jgi:hypothetical protein
MKYARRTRISPLPLPSSTYIRRDVDDFRPERHHDIKGDVLPGPAPKRRIGRAMVWLAYRCPDVGKHPEKESLFINTARILWAATLERARDENGKELPLNPNAFVERRQ